MKVPHISLWLVVRVPDDKGMKWVVCAIDKTAGTFDVRTVDDEFRRQLNIVDYDPVPSLHNFYKAIDQWDYYSNMSDSDAVITEGKEMAKALRIMFKELPTEDQHRLQKIVDIVVHV